MEGTVTVVQMCALFVCTYVQLCTYVYVYVYVRMCKGCVCTYVCMCVCVCVCVQESQSKAVGECKSEYERILSEQDRRHKVCVGGWVGKCMWVCGGGGGSMCVAVCGCGCV